MFDYQKAKTLLAACPLYKETVIRTIFFNKQEILIKDESTRMGLGSFKALGGFYAVAQLIANEVNRPLAPDEYFSFAIQQIARDMTFVCASAGNHGLSVASGAKTFGAKSRIHLAKTVPEDFANRLRAKGAVVIRSGLTYEDSVAAATEDADLNNAIHLADGSWLGYTEPPRLVMEGYTVIAEELRMNFEHNHCWPTHVYLQAGVGGFAAAISYMIRLNWQVQPQIIIVEPALAPCLSVSVKKNKLQTVQGCASNMGRLDCKTPSLLAFEILQHQADKFTTITDDEAMYYVTVAQRLGFDTTPSGVAGLAALIRDSAENHYPLAIISEGNTNG